MADLNPWRETKPHSLNCAKLMPNGPHACSCGAEANKYQAINDSAEQEPGPMAVHNHGPEQGPGLSCLEYTDKMGNKRGYCMDEDEVKAAVAGYVAKMVSPKLPPYDGQVHNHRVDGDGALCKEHTLSDGRRKGDCLLSTAAPEAATVPPVDSGDLAGILTQWWLQKANEEATELVPKMQEYGGMHRASDLTQLGRSMADLIAGAGNFTEEGDLQELACYFYLQGKMGRWQAALLEGRRVSDDTIHDIKIYTTMVQRIREAGGWPV
jgi:hypothetical protein